MRFDTYASVTEALSGHKDTALINIFENCLLTPDGYRVKTAYDKWLNQEYERLVCKVDSLFMVLFDHPGYQRYFLDFLRKVTSKSKLPRQGQRRLQPKEKLPPEEDYRRWLALYRAVEPLVDAETTLGVERSWKEMHEGGHLRPYLRSSLERERIMLERERDLARINSREPSYVSLEDLPADIEPTAEQTRYRELLRRKAERQEAERARMPEAFSVVCSGDQFKRERCVRCGFRLYSTLFGGSDVWLCSKCAAGRIAELRERIDKLPVTLAELEERLLERVIEERKMEPDTMREKAVRRAASRK
jgi:hypothetical protein